MTVSGECAERAFFRSEFEHSTLVLAARGGPEITAPERTRLADTVRALIDGDCRVLIVAAAVGNVAASDVASSLGITARPLPGGPAEVADLWIDLVDRGVQVVAATEDPAPTAAALSVQLGVAKLVITDPHGGGDVSFGSEEFLQASMDERPAVARAALQSLQGGVAGVNLCRLEDLDTELFTFDGAGTLFTRDAYVQVAPLRADDLPVVEGLVQRGVAEGFLRPRSRGEIVRLALGGLGARVAPSGHLAGLGTLEVERYAADGVGEVACLYTVNRFTGEGVGGDLVDGLVCQARQAGCHAVFACTVSERAAALFERSGFIDVAQERLPATKWSDYDPERRTHLRTLWMDLDGVANPPSSRGRR